MKKKSLKEIPKKKIPKKYEMKTIYYDIKKPAAFGGVEKLAKKTRNTKKITQQWLSDQPTYSLHKPYRKRFPTRAYRTTGLNDLWQMDLMEMIPYDRVNKGYRYILTVIDVFSRFARAVPVKSKSANDIKSALQLLFKNSNDVKPRHIQTDQGKEFYNSKVQGLFKKMEIKHYSIFSQYKAAIVERFNRTLRTRIKGYFTFTGKKIWYDKLQDMIDAYNKTKHSSIYNIKPKDITNETEMKLWRMIDDEETKKNKKKPIAKIKLLSYVRISRTNSGVFTKNFDQNWSEEIFKVVGIDDKTNPVMYIIEDLNHNVIGGKFYQQELQVIHSKPEIFRIEKVIRTQGKGAYKRLYVKWYGYGNEHNSWISGDKIVENKK